MMIRAQIYLTSIERQALHQLVSTTGKSQSELIREAIDQFLESKLKQKQNKLSILHAVKGIWAKRDDLPDFSNLRKEFDRQSKI